MTTKEWLAKLYAFNAKVDFDITSIEEYIAKTKGKSLRFRTNCQEVVLPFLRNKRELIIREIAEETDDGEVIRLSREAKNE